MLQAIIKRLGEVINRRGFLGRAASACSALGLALFGMDQLAFAGGGTGCCNLCNTDCVYPQPCNVQWCWSCPFGTGTGCRLWNCKECLGNTNEHCGNVGCPVAFFTCSCSQVVCSHGYNTGMPCF